MTTSRFAPPARDVVVSVVLPVRDGEAFLAEAIESVLGQTLDELELVVVDDGSADSSREIADAFVARDSRVRVVTQPIPAGISRALNLGWRTATGRYVARMDADDVSLPDRLERQITFMTEHPDVGVVGGAVLLIDERGAHVGQIRYPATDAAIRARLVTANPFAHPSVVIRREELGRVGGYRLDHVEDYDLWLRLAPHTRFANLEEPVLLYRRHARQVSVEELDEQARRLVAVRYAAGARRSGRPDPLEGLDEIPDDALSRMGVSASEVEAAMFEARVAWAHALERVGAARASAALAAAGCAAGGRSTFNGALEIERAKSALGDGRRAVALVHALAAFVIAPRYAAHRLRRVVAVRRRRSAETGF